MLRFPIKLFIMCAETETRVGSHVVFVWIHLTEKYPTSFAQ